MKLASMKLEEVAAHIERRNFRQEKYYLYYSHGYLVSSTGRDRESWTVTNTRTQRSTMLHANIKDMLRLYPITSSY